VSNDQQIEEGQTSSGGEIGLLEISLIIAKHFKVILVVPCAVALITAVCTLLVPNVFTAKAMILPKEDDSAGMTGIMMAQIGGLASLAGGGLGGATKADLYVTMMNTETIKDPIIDRFKLMHVYQVKARANAYSELEGNSKITVGKKDGVITIAVSDEEPKLAAAMANAYVDELGKLTAKLNMTDAGGNRVFLEKRLVKSKADLAAAEDALKTFQVRTKAVAVTDQAKVTLERVAMLHAQLVAQEVQLAALRRQFTAESQEIKVTNSTIANLRGQIARLEGGGSEGSMPGVGAMPQLGQEYMRLMREFKIQETLVELLTKQYEMTKLNESKDVAPFQILQEARAPEVKSKPKRSLIVLLAAVSTLFLTLFVIFIKEFFSRMSAADRRLLCEIKKLLPLHGR